MHKSINATFAICVVGTLFSVLIAGCSTTQRLPSWMTFSSESGESLIEVPWQTSFAEARAEAEKTDKLILLFFTGSDWCKYCMLLEREVFHTPEFAQWYPENVVPVLVDSPRETSLEPAIAKQNEKLKKQFANQVTSYPTALFINTQGDVIGKLGYLPGGPDTWTYKADEILALSF